jgi:hypothetical protein
MDANAELQFDIFPHGMRGVGGADADWCCLPGMGRITPKCGYLENKNWTWMP